MVNRNLTHMLYILDHSTDPQWNLAAEEYLFKKMEKPIFRLWRNTSSIIIGLHQNAYAEINSEYIKKNEIPVVRRLTGGGAVFHDLGNVNFTFIDNKIANEENSEMFARFTKPILEALQELGIKAELKGRNDLVIDDKKFSGNAVAVYKGRVLQHGTLLFSSSMSNLSEALKSRPEQFESKAVKSNRARVTNISDHLKQAMDIKEFMEFMERFIVSRNFDKFMKYSYSVDDLKEIAKLKHEKYSKDSWNYGTSPAYSFSKVKRFDWGLLELYLNIEKGFINSIRFHGNYFFTEESSQLEELLNGSEHNVEKIRERIKKINLSDYFNGINEEEFISMFV